MHLEKPTLARHLGDPTLKGYAVLQKIFFAPTSSSQAAGGAFIERLAQRSEDLDPASGPDVAAAQMAAFREWEQSTGTRFGDLKGIHQPTLVVNGIHDEMIPVSNSYRLAENLPNAVLARVPGLRTRLPLPVSRLLHPARGGIPRVGRAVRAVTDVRIICEYTAWEGLCRRGRGHFGGLRVVKRAATIPPESQATT